MHRAAPLLLLSLALIPATHAADDFVVVKGGVLRPGIPLDDFELPARPITHADYMGFVDDD